VCRGFFAVRHAAVAQDCRQVARHMHDPNGIIDARLASLLAPDLGACIGTAQVGVSLVSLFDPLFKRSRLHFFDICLT